MNTTQHASVRLQQRAIHDYQIAIVMEFGRFEAGPGGVTKVFLGKREAWKIPRRFKKQMIEKAIGTTLIIKDGLLITAYRRN